MFWSLCLLGEKHFSLRRDSQPTGKKKKKVNQEKKQGNIKRITSTTVAI